MAATLLWLRRDLRLTDHAALEAALRRGDPVLPVYVAADGDEGEWAPGAASRWWLHHSLASLDADLRERGSRLTLRRGAAARELASLARECGAKALHFSRRYEPHAVAAERVVDEALRGEGIEVESHNTSLLAEPWEIENSSRKPFQVYSAYRRELMRTVNPAQPRGAPRALKSPPRWPRGVRLEELDLMPRIAWYATMARTWRPGEAGALANLKRFVKDALARYGKARDVPAVAGTSRLSPHLHFGEIGPRQIWHAIGPKGRSSQFLAELVWREFAHHLLHHFPQTTKEPLREQFAAFPWKRDAQQLAAWRRGRTGIPMVDAGMRELWATGWMHNRVRLIVASYLTKNLLQPWQDGTRWFWDTLVDADLANNSMNWQWVAGCGADAAPYFRIFNPVTQGERFDPDGEYVRRWVPELAELPDRYVHAPWTAPTAVLEEAGVALGTDYPRPIVDLKASREAALEAYEEMRRE